MKHMLVFLKTVILYFRLKIPFSYYVREGFFLCLNPFDYPKDIDSSISINFFNYLRLSCVYGHLHSMVSFIQMSIIISIQPPSE